MYLTKSGVSSDEVARTRASRAKRFQAGENDDLQRDLLLEATHLLGRQSRFMAPRATDARYLFGLSGRETCSSTASSLDSTPTSMALRVGKSRPYLQIFQQRHTRSTGPISAATTPRTIQTSLLPKRYSVEQQYFMNSTRANQPMTWGPTFAGWQEEEDGGIPSPLNSRDETSDSTLKVIDADSGAMRSAKLRLQRRYCPEYGDERGTFGAATYAVNQAMTRSATFARLYM